MQYSFINEEKPQDVFEHFYVVEHKGATGGTNANSGNLILILGIILGTIVGLIVAIKIGTMIQKKLEAS